VPSIVDLESNWWYAVCCSHLSVVWFHFDSKLFIRVCYFIYFWFFRYLYWDYLWFAVWTLVPLRGWNSSCWRCWVSHWAVMFYFTNQQLYFSNAHNLLLVSDSTAKAFLFIPWTSLAAVNQRCFALLISFIQFSWATTSLLSVSYLQLSIIYSTPSLQVLHLFTLLQLHPSSLVVKN